MWLELYSSPSYIIISRTTLPEEFRFIDDSYSNNVVTNVYDNKIGGALQIEYYELEIITTNPQYRDDLYNLTKFMILRDRKLLLSKGIFQIHRTSGKDIPMDTTTNLPVLLYKASLLYSVTARMTYQNIDAVMEDFVIVNTFGGPLVSGGHYVMPGQFTSST